MQAHNDEKHLGRDSSLGSDKAVAYQDLDPAEERRLLRKIDMHVVPMMILFYLLSFLDRTNIGNAKIDGLTKDLKLNDYNYRIALTILYVPYILAEIPSNLLVKKVGANTFLPVLVTIWGIVATLQGIVVNKEGLWADRFFLGLTEGGILPAIILYLSAWYRPHELQFRIGLFWSAASLAGAFGGLLAAALGLIQAGGKNGWSWIFIVEGLITVIVGLSGFWLIPKNVSSCSFLTELEKEQVRHRLLGATGHDEESEPFSWSEIGSTFLTPHLWLLGVMAFCSGIAVYSIAYFLPTITSTFGYTVWTTQLLTVPFYVFSFILTFICSIWADRIKQRSQFIIFPQILAIAGLAILYTCTRDHRGKGPRYFAIFLLVGGVYSAVPGYLAWSSNLFANHYRRATALGCMIVMTNSGGLASTWLFRTVASPNYELGYSVVIGLLALGTLIALFLRFYFIAINKARARRLQKRQEQGVVDSKQGNGGRDLGDREDTFIYTI